MSEYDKDTCPKCGADNYYPVSDGQDMTAPPDSPSCKCWSCGQKWWIADIKDSEVLECLEDDGDWDPDKSEEENLASASCEDGRPSDDYDSSEYEKFLNSYCPATQTIWLGYIHDQLAGARNRSVWHEVRLKRIEIAVYYSDWDIGPYRDKAEYITCHHDLADALEKAEFIKQGKKGTEGAIRDAYCQEYRRELESMLRYILRVSWGEMESCRKRLKKEKK